MEPGESNTGLYPAGESPTIAVRSARSLAAPLTAADKRALKSFVRELAGQLLGGRAFHCLLSNDKKLRELNCQFLNHDYTTDVLSFPSADTASVGDLAISLERAQAQADEFGHSLVDEIRVLLLHGVLHLIGYDHERDGGEMGREERKWRAHFGLPQTLIQRTRSRVGAAR